MIVNLKKFCTKLWVPKNQYLQDATPSTRSRHFTNRWQCFKRIINNIIYCCYMYRRVATCTDRLLHVQTGCYMYKQVATCTDGLLHVQTGCYSNRTTTSHTPKGRGKTSGFVWHVSWHCGSNSLPICRRRIWPKGSVGGPERRNVALVCLLSLTVAWMWPWASLSKEKRWI